MIHTAGPWTIYAGHIIQANHDGLMVKQIAEIKYSGPGAAEGNAYLLAAAPELFDGLKEAITLLETSNIQADRFRRIIDKAEGK